MSLFSRKRNGILLLFKFCENIKFVNHCIKYYANHDKIIFSRLIKFSKYKYVKF